MGGHFPDNQQTLLLKAALSERLKAIRFFVEWLEVNQLDRLDPASKTFLTDFMDRIDEGSHRLLPLVIHNLGDDTHPYFKFLLGTRKNYWVKNKQTEFRATQVLSMLAQQGIPAMLIRGLDLASRFYHNPGLRPMSNGDILIPYEYKNAAFALAEKGLLGNKTHTYILKAKNIAQTIHLEFDGELNVDLHWSIFREYTHDSDASNFIWEYTAKVEKSYTMAATHALFVSLVKGSRFEQVPPFGWVADAEMIIRKTEIDWEEILELIKRFHFKPFLKRAFLYLADQYQVNIPDDFLEKLKVLTVSEDEEKYYRVVSANPGQYGILSRVWFETLKKVHLHKLLPRNADIPLSKDLFLWYINRIKAKLSS